MTVPDAIGPYKIDQEVDPGHCTPVWRAIDTTTGKPVAIKAITKLSSASPGHRNIKYEIELQKELDFPFIAKLYDVIETPFSLFLVMELANGCSLADVVNQKGGFPEAQIKTTFCQLVATLEYLHSRGVVHRDIKGENLMLDYNRNLKMIDFGLSSMFETGVYKTACGSPVYTAPEVIKRVSYGKSADIWSLGVLLYLMATGEFPFEDESMPKLLHKVAHEPVPVPQGVSKELRDLLQRLLQKQPEKRIELTEIFDHPWIASAYPLSERKRRMLFKSCISEDFMDRQIVEELEALNVDTHELREFLMRGKYNALTAMYRIKRRAKAIEEFNTRQHEEETMFVRRASFPSTHAVELHQGILEKASQRLFAKNKVSVAFKRQLTSANARLSIRPVLRRERSHSPNRK